MSEPLRTVYNLQRAEELTRSLPLKPKFHIKKMQLKLVIIKISLENMIFTKLNTKEKQSNYHTS